MVERKHAGKKLTVKCHKSGDDVSLLELLDGLKLENLPNWAARPSKSDSLQTIRIFLASSAELREDRDEFDLYFSHVNDHLIDQKSIRLEIVRWEYSVDAMSKTRLQDEYNRKVRDCHIFVSLFKHKVGKHTEEEFDVAWETFRETGRPQIFTYFRDFPKTNDESNPNAADDDSLNRFQKRLSDLGHFYTTYNDAEHLKRQFRDQLTQLGFLN